MYCNLVSGDLIIVICTVSGIWHRQEPLLGNLPSATFASTVRAVLDPSTCACNLLKRPIDIAHESFILLLFFEHPITPRRRSGQVGTFALQLVAELKQVALLLAKTNECGGPIHDRPKFRPTVPPGSKPTVSTFFISQLLGVYR